MNEARQRSLQQSQQQSSQQQTVLSKHDGRRSRVAAAAAAASATSTLFDSGGTSGSSTDDNNSDDAAEQSESSEISELQQQSEAMPSDTATVSATTAAGKQQQQVNWSLVADRMWEDWQLPVLIVLLGAVSVVLLTLLILLWLKNQMLPRSKSESASPGQWIFHPVVKPPLETCDAQPSSQQQQQQQPAAAAVSVAATPPPGTNPLVNTTEVRPEPIRNKPKGLLERRGSSASLTIDLHPSQENLAVVTPTKECSTQEFLLSAGNCYSRGQLRCCLKDVRALHTEFWDIPSNIPEKTELAGSGTKNRYRSILPNEHTRVKLPEHEGDPLTGYINANYVRGYDGEERTYIATQGPLPHTLHDFWSMVLAEHASAIVMITKLREKGRTKCEAYLPTSPGLPMEIEDIQVQVISVTERPGYVIREVNVKKGEEPVLCLRHFWFTDWPDHKTPDDAGPLVAMAREACESKERSDASPIVVHCSAGIGRTGCFIALATGMRQLRDQSNVDVLGIVCALRQDRGGMVQTAEQYEFLHKALCLYERTLPGAVGE